MLPTSSHVRVDSACAQPNQATAKNPRNSAVSPASRRDFTGPTLSCLVSAVQYLFVRKVGIAYLMRQTITADDVMAEISPQQTLPETLALRVHFEGMGPVR
jgi:hypothetical protein